MLISVDSADHYADIEQRYAAGSNAVLTAGAGRKGTAGIATEYNSTFFVEQLTLFGETIESLTLFRGFALWLVSLPPSGRCTLLQFMESDFTPHIAITVDDTGTIEAYKGTQAGTLLASAASPVAIETYYYLEVKAFIDNATGNVQMKLWTGPATSNTIINFTGGTQNGGTGLLSVIGHGADGLTLTDAIPPEAQWDDFYVCDATGSAFNSFLGNKHIQASFPEAAGNYTQWQPFPSAPNYGNVNEDPPNDDATYNFAPSVDGDTDTFAMQDTTASLVDAAVVNLCMKLAAEGAEGASAVIRLDGEDAISEQIIPTTGYLIHQYPFETAPSGGAWSALNFNNSEVGYTAHVPPSYWLLPYLSVYTAGTPIAVTPNEVRVMRIFIPYNMLVSRITIRIGTTDVGNFWGTGLYDEDGNLVIDSGPISTATLGPVGVAITPITLKAGTYWYAWTSDSATATASTASIGLAAATIREDGSGNWGFVANASIAGQLPATMGAFTPEAPVVDAIPLAALH